LMLLGSKLRGVLLKYNLGVLPKIERFPWVPSIVR
jgi:hypothetical protein